MSDEMKLLPCPFCGGTDISVDHAGVSSHYFVQCNDCDVVQDYDRGYTRDEAIAVWNTRATLEATTVKGDGLVGWQPIETAPVGEIVDWWIEGLDEPGWRVTGLMMRDDVPLCIVREDSLGQELYHPHENGGFPTHWRPLPAAPGEATLEAADTITTLKGEIERLAAIPAIP